jgi:hypothetical protein
LRTGALTATGCPEQFLSRTGLEIIFFHIPEITMKRVPAEVRWRRDPILEQLGQFGCVFGNCLARRLGPLPAIVSPDVLTSVEHSSENVAVAVETHGYPQKLRQVS